VNAKYNGNTKRQEKNFAEDIIHENFSLIAQLSTSGCAQVVYNRRMTDDSVDDRLFA
jgi:hypothetical protein